MKKEERKVRVVEKHDWNVPTDDPAILHLQYARGHLLSSTNAPYLATAAMALQFVPRADINTMAVDGSWRLYYNPDKIVYWSVEGLAAVMEHEIWHLLREHAERARENDVDESTRLRWNYAADAEIHSDDNLVNRLREIPGSEGMVTPDSLGLPKNKVVEWYFAMLENEGEPEPRGYPGGEPEPRGYPGGKAGPLDPEEEGSGSSGIQEDFEDEPTDNVLNSAEEKLVKKKVAEDIRKHEKRVKNKEIKVGKIPGDVILDWADEVLSEGEVDWRDELEVAMYEAIESSSDPELTTTRLSRRQDASPHFILYGTWSLSPNVAVVLDTSASMMRSNKRANNLLLAAMAEIDAVIQEYQGIGIQVFVTDTHVRSDETIFDINELKIVGLGGTNMRVGIDAAADSENDPSVIVVLTDGETPWPRSAPSDAYFVVGIIGNKGIYVPKWVDSVIYID